MQATSQPITPDEARRRYAIAIDALNGNDWAAAQRHAMQLILDAPPHGGVCFVAGVAAIHLEQVPLAVDCLNRATRLSPMRGDYWTQFARALLMMRMPTEASQAVDHALATLQPQDLVSLDTLGVVCSQLQRHGDAARLMREVATRIPDDARLRFNLAMSLMYAGEIEASEKELDACLQTDPDYWKAYLSRAQLRTWSRGENHVAQLESAVSQSRGSAEQRMYLNLALAKELEDLGEYSRAFAHLRDGKAAGAEGRDYRFERDAALFAAIQSAFPEPSAAVSGHDSAEPIFVFGMPRSGTTLVDRILSSHSQVMSAGELENFGVALKRASGSQTSTLIDVDTVERSLGVDFAQLGMQYIESTRPLTGGTPRFVDKLPHNFLYAGWIAQALPRARLICLRRDPVDTCLSNFRQLFAQTSPFYDYSFDLLDTGRYVIAFDRLMQHWDRMFPGRILQLRYEDLVEQQEETTRKLLEFCGLRWESACLQFERNAAPVTTASAVQVRSGMFRTSMQRWKRYEAETADLRLLLSEAGLQT